MKTINLKDISTVQDLIDNLELIKKQVGGNTLIGISRPSEDNLFIETGKLKEALLVDETEDRPQILVLVPDNKVFL